MFSNRGWAILFESASKICVVNLAQTHVTPTSACPAGADAVTYTYANGTYSTAWKLMTSATRGGQTRTYGYASNDHVNCIIDPGQTVCRIQNTYAACPEDPDLYLTPVQPNVRLRDYVTSQTDASGRIFTYSYSANGCPRWVSDTNPDYRPLENVTTTMTESGVPGNTIAVTDTSSQVVAFTDQLQRTSQYAYEGSEYYGYETGGLIENTLPEGSRTYVTKDARANLTSSVTVAKAGSGLPNIVQGAVYPTTCSNIITCNKPSSTNDARSAVTDYTYDPTHGGILTVSGPAGPNGIRPVARTSYVQRSAWLKNSGGTYTASIYPIWLKSEDRSCRTSALDPAAGTCSAGAGDLVRTLYDYGPNAGPNNLLLRGVAVEADGLTLRTCHLYDTQGRKISETKPLGTGATCP